MMWGPGVAGLMGLEERVWAGCGRSCWHALLAAAPTTRLPWARKEPCGNWVEAGQPQVLPGQSSLVPGGELEPLAVIVRAEPGCEGCGLLGPSPQAWTGY